MTTRYIQEELLSRLIHEDNTRMCCPLSFCGSMEHTTVQDCDHPHKLSVIEPIHIHLLRNFQERIDGITYPFDRDTRPIITILLNEVKQAYFEGIPIDEEQMHILLFRLKVPTTRYWNVSYEERIDLVLNAYRKIIRRFMDPIVIEPNVFDNSDGNSGIEEDDQEDLLDLDRAFENEPFLIPDDEPMTPLELWVIHISHKGEPDAVMKQQECPICYDVGCHIMTNCAHAFCNCLMTYIERKRKDQEVAGCPCCRRIITELDVYVVTHV